MSRLAVPSSIPLPTEACYPVLRKKKKNQAIVRILGPKTGLYQTNLDPLPIRLLDVHFLEHITLQDSSNLPSHGGGRRQAALSYYRGNSEIFSL